MLEMIWGLKTTAIFDVWTIEHVLSGVSIGCAVGLKNRGVLKKLLCKVCKIQPHRKFLHFDMLGVLFLAYAWETLEHYLEVGLGGEMVEYWFQGVEFWPNRLIADPLMLVIGYFIAEKHGKLVVPARILSVIWLIVHVFIFPHSMYLHELF
jgi:hypothetical protein